MLLYTKVARPWWLNRAGNDLETAHDRAFAVLDRLERYPGMLRLIETTRCRSLGQTIGGVYFPNPVGPGAGLNKNGLGMRSLGALCGFGFLEIGSVLPLPQPGNPRPRLVELPLDRALINWMGFDSDGMEALYPRLLAYHRTHPIPVLLNMSKNLSTKVEDATDDILRVFNRLHALVDGFVINPSSPNTPGLRRLQGRELLTHVVATIRGRIAEIARLTLTPEKPCFVKISPDLTLSELDDIIEVALEFRVTGLVVTNTTIRREGLRTLSPPTVGGLSGKPLLHEAFRMVRHVNAETGGRLVVIGCGGISSAAEAYTMVRGGCSLVEVLTSLVRENPLLPHHIRRGLCTAATRAVSLIDSGRSRHWPRSRSRSSKVCSTSRSVFDRQ
ncbi:MAG: quinone-dependent dihydroorotate dehydrogenase [Candidatus Andersenbacteria bacterium]